MKNSELLTIIIPAKNEEATICRLLTSIAKQTYSMRDVPIFIADAGSTDSTVDLARSIALPLNLRNLHIIGGGLPAVGRNIGAKYARSKYLLFLDADVSLADPDFVLLALTRMERKGLHCATTDIMCDGSWKAKFAYAVNNFCQRCSRFFGRPFSTGMCMFFKRSLFLSLDGFREDALFAEDYMLSKQVGWRRFRVIPGGVVTSDRRIQKMGFWKVAKMFLSVALFSHKDSAFTKDRGYW